ncbi:hypothetical protein ACXR2U_04820 [Jatrophihabitans sp. YIM 134969]
MTITNDVDFQRLRNTATEVIRIASTRGYPLPDGWGTLQALRVEVQKLTIEPEPVAAVTALPAPGKAKEWCTRQATARQQHRDRVTVARELSDRLELDSVRAGRGHAAAVCDQLVNDVNTDLLPRLQDLLNTAPRTLTGHESAEAVEAHTALLRIIGEATQAAYDRGQLALALGEGDDLGHYGAVFLLIDPPAGATVRDVDQAVIDIRGGLPNTLEHWARLQPLGLSLAEPGGALRRSERYQHARAALMNTGDGGVFDHTLGELLDLANDPDAAANRARRVA